MVSRAEARPTKQLFVEMLTRDISLEDAILDLIDNPIDSLIGNEKVSFITDPEVLFDTDFSISATRRRKIEITIRSSSVSIKDNCGGIEYDTVRKEVFRLGKPTPGSEHTLSVYGIGLKRAIFKIGMNAIFETRTTSTGARVNIDVKRWLAQKGDEWWFPLESVKPASRNAAGTAIEISNLTPEAAGRIKSGSFLGQLSEAVARTYILFLGRYVDIFINGKVIAPKPFPIGESDGARASARKMSIDGVAVSIFAGLTERSAGKWKLERAGWYVFCNGRAVVFADKSALTDWGVGLPQFVPKYRGFGGMAFFFSEDPELLPWTTTKTGLNRDAIVFQRAVAEMTPATRLVLRFLDRMYASEEPEEPAERDVAESVRSVSLKVLGAREQSDFAVTLPKRTRDSETINVQYKIKRSEFEKAQRCLDKPSWAAGRIGRYAFDYVLKREC